MLKEKLKETRPSAGAREDSSRPLSALLSQVLVAYTVEFDNELELRMGEAGYTGARLSLVLWSNLMRFVSDAGISVRDLAAQALDEPTAIKFQLGCLERWGFVALDWETHAESDKANAGSRSHRALRDGWGSGRGIGAAWVVLLTAKGSKAKETWPRLFDVIDERWRKRFGDEHINRLRASLLEIVGRIDVELPQAVTNVRGRTFPARVTRSAAALPVPTLLSQTLLAFAIEFERESDTPLAFCANVLRVLGDKAIRVSDIPRLTGGSPEMTAIGWQLKPYVAVVPDPAARRGKVARLTARGIMAQRNYHPLVAQIEKRWGSRYGEDAIRKCANRC
jgi:hypothetical protein